MNLVRIEGISVLRTRRADRASDRLVILAAPGTADLQPREL